MPNTKIRTHRHVQLSCRDRASNEFCRGKSSYYFSSDPTNANANNNRLADAVSPTLTKCQHGPGWMLSCKLIGIFGKVPGPGPPVSEWSKLIHTNRLSLFSPLRLVRPKMHSKYQWGGGGATWHFSPRFEIIVLENSPTANRQVSKT